MRVQRLLDADRFASLLGARLVEASADRVIVEMEVAAHHRDASGEVSSGVLFSLADCAMSLISNAERTAVAVATHFTRGGRIISAPSLRAVAQPELPVGDRATTWVVLVMAGETPIASFTGTTLQLET